MSSSGKRCVRMDKDHKQDYFTKKRQHDRRPKSGAFHSQLFVCPRLLALNMIWAGESYQWVRTRGRSTTNWSLGVKYCDSTSYSSSSSYVCPYSGLANFTFRQAAKALPAMCASVCICLNAGLAGIISALRWQFISILGRSTYPRPTCAGSSVKKTRVRGVDATKGVTPDFVLLLLPLVFIHIFSEGAKPISQFGVSRGALFHTWRRLSTFGSSESKSSVYLMEVHCSDITGHFDTLRICENAPQKISPEKPFTSCSHGG